MKKIAVFVFLALLLQSCSTFIPASRTTTSMFLDYRSYMSEGFFISPDPYPGICETLGELAVEVVPAQMEIDELSVAYFDGVFYRNMKYYGYERIPYNALLDAAVKEARSLGADGIVNLKIHKSEGVRIYYMVSGVCIKR